VKVAASWCKRNEISGEALCEVGVPARVLARAGLGTGDQPRRAPRARSCRNAITMASVVVDEIRLRAHARLLDQGDA
jgi:hypothetical protein